jgi:hypothetical protein
MKILPVYSRDKNKNLVSASRHLLLLEMLKKAALLEN